MNEHGLTAEQIRTIATILSPYADRIETVALFGSRAQGTYRPDSDIDMVLYGSVGAHEIARLHTLFDDSSLPFPVDIKAYQLIDYGPLKDHIDRVAVPLLRQRDLTEDGFNVQA
ncbi:MAG: nucleotidyltransferase domain-containing protein [Alphaproteobacteria bacterium]|nr:nucleotidyltransferase domain-containing protein [Alphaproteobacteria bacterium]